MFLGEEKEGGVSQLVDELPHRMTRYCNGGPSNGFVDLVLLSFSLLSLNLKLSVNLGRNRSRY